MYLPVSPKGSPYDWVRPSLLFMLRSHMVSIPVEKEEFCKPGMRTDNETKLRAGLFHSSSVLTGAVW